MSLLVHEWGKEMKTEDVVNADDDKLEAEEAGDNFPLL